MLTSGLVAGIIIIGISGPAARPRRCGSRYGRRPMHVLRLLAVSAMSLTGCSGPDPRPPPANAPPPAPPAKAPDTLMPEVGESAVAEPVAIALRTGTGFRFKGLALDPDARTAFLGSWDRKQILAVHLRDGTRRLIATRYSGKLNGMGLYRRDGKLYAVMNEVNDRPGARALSVLVVIDATDLTVLRSYELRGRGGRHHFNHVVVNRRGVAYVSDTVQSSIYTVDTENPADRLGLLIEHEDLSWVHGLDLSPDEKTLFTTSYRAGIKFLDVETLEFSSFRDPATAGDDGLRYHEGSLFGVGGNAIKRYVLNEAENTVVRTELFARDHERFNDPRCLHIQDGWLYVLANIELEPVTFRNGRASREQPLTDSYVIKYRLRPGA
jgi:hypothetical protein